MEEKKEIKEVVKEKYSIIATQSKEENENSCCGVDGCCTVDYAVFAEDYTQIKGYNPEADLGLGCGLPTEFALIKEGNVVVDLGSGAGNDCFIARELVGEKGKVLGLDMTEVMIEKARNNTQKLGFNNVEFKLGEIEEMPIENNFADVVVSNCVLNLVPNKVKAISETYRILKPGGHFSISDVVLNNNLPEGLKQDAEMYAGCVSGAILKDDYLNIIKQSGFTNITVQKEKLIILPDDILSKYLNENEMVAYKKTGSSILSVTVYAEKPL